MMRNSPSEDHQRATADHADQQERILCATTQSTRENLAETPDRHGAPVRRRLETEEWIPFNNGGYPSIPLQAQVSVPMPLTTSWSIMAPLCTAVGFPHSSIPCMRFVDGFNDAVGELRSASFNSRSLVHGSWRTTANGDPYLDHLDQDDIIRGLRDHYGESNGLARYLAKSIENRDQLMPLVEHMAEMQRQLHEVRRNQTLQTLPRQQDPSAGMQGVTAHPGPLVVSSQGQMPSDCAGANAWVRPIHHLEAPLQAPTLGAQSRLPLPMPHGDAPLCFPNSAFIVPTGSHQPRAEHQPQQGYQQQPQQGGQQQLQQGGQQRPQQGGQQQPQQGGQQLPQQGGQHQPSATGNFAPATVTNPVATPFISDQIATDQATREMCIRNEYTLEQPTMRNYPPPQVNIGWTPGEIAQNVTRFIRLAHVDANLAVAVRGVHPHAVAILGESLRALLQPRHDIHLSRAFSREIQTRRAIIDPIDPADPTREGTVDHLGSARGITLSTDQAQAKAQVSNYLKLVRPLVAVTVTYEAQRLLGSNHAHCRLADVDGWLRITPAEGAAVPERRRPR